MNEQIEERVAEAKEEAKKDAEDAKKKYEKKEKEAHEMYESFSETDRLVIAEKKKVEKKKAEYEAKSTDVRASVIAEVKEEHERMFAWWMEHCNGYCFDCRMRSGSEARAEEKEAAQLPCCRQQEQEPSATRLGQCAGIRSPHMHGDLVPRPRAYPRGCLRAHCVGVRVFLVVVHVYFAYALFLTRAHPPHTFYTRTGRSGPPRRDAAGCTAPAGPAAPARTARYRSDSHRRRRQWRRQQQLCTLHARTH